MKGHNPIKDVNGGQVGGPKQNYGKPNDRSFENRTGNPEGGRPSGGYTPQARKFRRGN